MTKRVRAASVLDDKVAKAAQALADENPTCEYMVDHGPMGYKLFSGVTNQ